MTSPSELAHLAEDAADPAPEHTAPQDTAPQDTAPQDTGAEDSASQGGDALPSLADPRDLLAAVEAILFVADGPLSPVAIAVGLDVPVVAVEAALADLATGYDARGAGIELRALAGGVRLYTRASVAGPVERFLQDGARSRLSQAALETLAVIAYRQPVTRSRVSAIRGVNVDGVVRTLLARGLIVESGTDPETGAGLFRTTDEFLERMGLQSLDELPSLAPLLPDIAGLDVDEL